jgi:restriction system protein
MAEITARRQGEMIQVLFQILAAEPDGLQAKEAIARVEGQLNLTPFERSTFPKNPDLVRFPKILRFATINSVKAGWLRKRSGTWTLTDEGKVALTTFADPESLFKESRRLYRQWKASQPDDLDEVAAAVDEADTADEGLIAATTLEEAEEAARQAILDYLAAMNPYSFQDLVGKLLEAMTYHVLWIAPKGKDGGLDLIAQSDPLGVRGPRIKGQVKRRPDNKVTEEELRSFLSLLEANDVGVYISLGGFTSDTQAAARRSSRRITLIDGEGLLDLWVEHYDRVDQEGRDLSRSNRCTSSTWTRLPSEAQARDACWANAASTAASHVPATFSAAACS